MDPILLLIAASTLVAAAIGVFAAMRTNRLRTQLEDRILMLEMELSTVRRDLIEASASGAATGIDGTDATAIDGFVCEPRIVEALPAHLDLDSETISTELPSTALAVADRALSTPVAEIVPVGNALTAVPPTKHPLQSRTWDPPAVTELALHSGPFGEQGAMNSLAKVGVVLLVLGVASLPWRPSNRLNSTR